MNVLRTAGTCAAALMVAIASRVAQPQSLKTALTELTNNDYAVRRTGFYRVYGLANNGYPVSSSLRPGAQRLAKYANEHPEVMTALITLLERENRPDPFKDNLPEDSYYGDLIGCVAQLNDPRAVNALLGAITTGRMAENGLAALGQPAVSGLLEKLRSQREHEMARYAAAGVLGKIALRRDATIDTAAIRFGLVNALSDRSMYVRSNAVVALTPFSGPDLRRAMDALATTDTAFEVHSGRRIYPVRAFALVWLRRDDSVKATRLPR